MSTERAPQPPRETRPGRRAVRKVGVTVVGASMVAVGVPMLVLPGPGLLMIGGGLAVLAAEFPAARRVLDRVKGVATPREERHR